MVDPNSLKMPGSQVRLPYCSCETVLALRLWTITLSAGEITGEQNVGEGESKIRDQA